MRNKTWVLFESPKIWRFIISLEFCIKDFWIGLYWDDEHFENGFLDLYFCIIPFFPIHICYTKHDW
jgi:hypothetical protein